MKSVKKIRYREEWSLEIHSENFPLNRAKSPLYVSWKRHTGLRVPSILKVVVANWKLCIAFLNITLVYDTYVTASKNGTFLRIACHGKLSQVQTKPLFHVQRENKRL